MAKRKVKTIRVVEETMVETPPVKPNVIRFKVGTEIHCMNCQCIIGEFIEDVVKSEHPRLSQIKVRVFPKPGVEQFKWHCPRCGEAFINEVGAISTEEGWL